MLNQALARGGCCEFTGEWPEVGLSCKIMDKQNGGAKQNRAAARRKSHVER
jgi:hypothetical protein